MREPRGRELNGMSARFALRATRSVSILLLSLVLSVAGCDGGGDEPGTTDGAPLPGSERSPSGQVGPEPRGFPLELSDASGRTLVLRRPPVRILSLVPSATRILVALGAEDRLVGRTDYDSLAALQRLPSVGGGLQPSMETILALQPDLVILFSGESDRATGGRLEASHIPQFGVRPDRLADARGLILNLGRMVGEDRSADSIVARIDTTLAVIQRRVAGLPRVRVAYILGGNPPWVAGPGTFIDDLLTAAGGENAFSDLGDLYGPVSPEEFFVRKIGLLLAPEGAEVPVPIPVIPLERVPTTLEIPGPGLADSVQRLARILHPEAFR